MTRSSTILSRSKMAQYLSQVSILQFNGFHCTSDFFSIEFWIHRTTTVPWVPVFVENSVRIFSIHRAPHSGRLSLVDTAQFLTQAVGYIRKWFLNSLINALPFSLGILFTKSCFLAACSLAYTLTVCCGFHSLPNRPFTRPFCMLECSFSTRETPFLLGL